MTATVHTFADDPTTGRYWVWSRDITRTRPRRRWRHRGAHRSGAWTVAEVAATVERQRSAAAAAHRASLRRPAEPTVFLGSRYISVPLFLEPVGPGAADEMVATLTLMPPDGDQAGVPAIVDMSITACDDASTGPILIDSEEAEPC